MNTLQVHAIANIVDNTFMNDVLKNVEVGVFIAIKSNDDDMANGICFSFNLIFLKMK